MTVRKIAMRHLWNAGRHLEREVHAYYWPLGQTKASVIQQLSLTEAIAILAVAYNQVLGA